MTVSRQQAVADPGFITLCIQLAQSTFSEVMPEKSASRAADPIRPAAARRNWKQAVSDWLYHHELNEREAFLAGSADIFELERRIRQLERRPYF